ncbi:hypothetical protein MTP99_005485 [Tenebrio molitor]|nr:hypothetical protein MTP99_005485 [Tenebrio molitor]
MSEEKPGQSADKDEDDKKEEERRRFDYVIVVDKNIKKSAFYKSVVKFLNYLQGRGVTVELAYGNIKENVYIKLHISAECVENFATIYDINIEDVGHYYIPFSAINLQMCQTPLTLDRDIFYRKGEATNTERIHILYAMLCEARFGTSNDDNKYGINKLLRIGAVKDVYPLHDGPYELNGKSDEFLNDRQMLLKYWANFSVWYKEQPLNLIEKYYGTEVAFYFAWLGFYNKMLIPATVVGVICFLTSLIRLNVMYHDRLEDVCNSELIMCPRCAFGHSCIARPLKMDCYYARISVLFDNPATVFFAVFMSFWATIFMNLWKRLENVLKIRWNVTTSTIQAKTQTRLPFKEKATHKRVSTITGQLEPYTPTIIQIFSYCLSFGTCLLLVDSLKRATFPQAELQVGVVLIFVVGVIMYRIIMGSLIRMSNSTYLALYAPFIESCTSSMIQVVFIKLYGKFYAPLSEWLTNMENPRTQFEFDNSVVHKRYILGFANNYASLFYMAFLKGRFYSPSYATVTSLNTDLCHPCGCIMALCIQLFVMMLLKSMAGNILTLVVPKITKRFAKKPETTEAAPQWEEEYELYPAGRYLLTTEFMEMIVQYGFVTFFVAAFPLAPLCALINNCMELRLDAYKLVTRYRRPVPKKDSGIGPWRDILEVITHLSIATNAFVLAFTSDFVARQIYRFQNNSSLQGYILSTMSVYNMNETITFGTNDLLEITGSNSTLCYYRALRYPPDHPKKYELTTQYWYEIGIRLLCVIAFEHVIMLTNGVLAYFIPEMPQKIQQAVYHANTLNQQTRLQIMHEEAKKVRETEKKSKIRIKRKRT